MMAWLLVIVYFLAGWALALGPGGVESCVFMPRGCEGTAGGLYGRIGGFWFDLLLLLVPPLARLLWVAVSVPLIRHLAALLGGITLAVLAGYLAGLFLPLFLVARALLMDRWLGQGNWTAGLFGVGVMAGVVLLFLALIRALHGVARWQLAAMRGEIDARETPGGWKAGSVTALAAVWALIVIYLAVSRLQGLR
jgi:hypothetical protein